MRYEPASQTKPTATACQPGTRALQTALRDVFPELAIGTGPYGCFNHRRIASSTAWSLHAEGRALDAGVVPGSFATAWSIACHLVERRTLYGVMRVMWDAHIWSCEQPASWRSLQPNTNQHRDHMHIEQYRANAARPFAAVYNTMRAGLLDFRETLHPAP